MTLGQMQQASDLVKKMTIAIGAQETILKDMLELLQGYNTFLAEEVNKANDFNKENTHEEGV